MAEKENNRKDLKSGSDIRALKNLNEHQVVKDMGFYAITKRTQSGVENSIAIQFLMKNGDKLAIWYFEFTSPLKLISDSTIELNTSKLNVIITGTGLAELFDFICAHRVVVIREPESEFIEYGFVTVIQRIEIREGKN